MKSHQWRGIDQRPATNSNGQTVGTDSTAPGAPAAVRDVRWLHGYGTDIDCVNAGAGALYANFDPATDNETGISGYQYGFGTTPGATDIVRLDVRPLGMT